MKRAVIIFVILLLATMLIPFSAVIRDKQNTDNKTASPLIATVVTRQGTDPCPHRIIT